MTALTSRPGGPPTSQTAGAPQTLASIVFPGEGSTYALLDAAANPDLLDWLYRCLPEFECLYEGEVEPDVAEVAPYLVAVPAEGEFTSWLRERGWGKNWGIYVLSTGSFRDMRQHLRRFVKVHTEEGTPMLFRFYDPRVLRTYLPTCNPGEVAEFFGPAQAFVAEAEDPGSAMRFENSGGKLKTVTIKLKEG
ncbi:MAG: DUF4123 domain-containing protein [Bryobacteraceae bacterium]